MALMPAEQRATSSLQIGISTAVRECRRAALALSISVTANFFEFLQSEQNPATLLQNEKEIQENNTAKLTTIAISRLLSAGEGNVRAMDQLATAVCAKTSSAKTVLRRFALARHPARGELSLCDKVAGKCSSTHRAARKNTRFHSRRTGHRSMTAGFIDVREISGIDRIRAARVFCVPKIGPESRLALRSCSRSSLPETVRDRRLFVLDNKAFSLLLSE
jgi:hypothetical protein